MTVCARRDLLRGWLRGYNFGASAEIEDLRQHLRQCADCRAEYDRFALAHRFLEMGGADDFELQVSEFELALARDALFGGAPRQQQPQRRRFGGWVKIVLPLAAALGVVVLASIRQAADSDFHPRGGAEDLPSAIFAFCMDADGHLLGELEDLSGRARCPDHGNVQLAVRASDPYRYLLVYAVTPGGNLPLFHEEGRSRSVLTSERPLPLSHPIAVEDWNIPSSERVAVVSARRLSVSEVDELAPSETVEVIRWRTGTAARDLP